MKTLNAAQQLIFDSETQGLEHAHYSVSADFIKSIGFKFLRYHKLANFNGDDAELEVFEDSAGRKIVKICVTQFTHSEGELLHQSCYTSAGIMPQLQLEANKYNY